MLPFIVKIFNLHSSFQPISVQIPGLSAQFHVDAPVAKSGSLKEDKEKEFFILFQSVCVKGAGELTVHCIR